MFTGSGNLDMHQLGAIPNPSDGPMTGGALFRAVHEEMCERAEKEKSHENMFSTIPQPSTTS